MLGAIIGDIIGSTYEKSGKKNYDFDLFPEKSRFTDDTVLTLAVAEASEHYDTLNSYKISLINWAKRYPDVGFGRGFLAWLKEPIGAKESTGNGSAMRVSPVGFWQRTRYDVLNHAMASAMPSHNTPEAILGAQTVALAVHLCHRANVEKFDLTKERLQEELEEFSGYDLHTPISKIRPSYEFNVSCAGSVPQAIRCFLEAQDFEQAVRLAVSLGGDADTQASIAGAIAYAYHRSIPKAIMGHAFTLLPQEFIDKALAFHLKLWDREPTK